MRPSTTSDALPPLSSSQQVAEEHSRTNQSVQVREVKDEDDFKGDVGNNYTNIVVVGNTFIFGQVVDIHSTRQQAVNNARKSKILVSVI